MSKHTIELKKEELRIINVVKAVQDIKSIQKAISYIINDYSNTNSYTKFIDEKRGALNGKKPIIMPIVLVLEPLIFPLYYSKLFS